MTIFKDVLHVHVRQQTKTLAKHSFYVHRRLRVVTQTLAQHGYALGQVFGGNYPVCPPNLIDQFIVRHKLRMGAHQRLEHLVAQIGQLNGYTGTAELPSFDI